MNTTEKIVESYFRVVRNCFTIPDQKVISGNNRQLDILAFNKLTNDQYHVEVSVKNDSRWSPDISKLEELFDKKFLGEPRKKTEGNTDWNKGKNYYENILNTYKFVGFDSNDIKRVWVAWVCKDSSDMLTEFLQMYSKNNGFINPVEFISFKAEILPELMQAVEKSHYEEDSLRTLSLMKLMNS